MSDKSGEVKEKAEGKPITDKDLEDISGGIIIQRPATTTVTTDTTSGFQDAPDGTEWNNPPDGKS